MVHAVETPDVPSSLRFLSLPGGAIRTIVSANVNTFIESTFGPASKNAIICQLAIGACVIHILQQFVEK